MEYCKIVDFTRKINMKNLMYIMVTDWKKHWDGISEASYPKPMIHEAGKQLEKIKDNTRTIFIKKNTQTKVVEKLWEGFVNNITVDTEKISFDVNIKKDILPIPEYSNYKNGWYVVEAPQNLVFVIMKFEDKDLDSAYEGVIKPIIEKYGYHPLRIDEIQDSGIITDQILKSIESSKLVLSDLTGERPNCYYETGYAQALGKELILAIKKDEPVHFDLAGHRIIEWETEADLRRKLNDRFESILSKDR
jgi:hypothetical protein